MEELIPIFLQGIIAFCAFFALLSGVIKMFLIPVEKDIKTLKEGQKELRKEINSFVSILQREIESLKKELRKNNV